VALKGEQEDADDDDAMDSHAARNPSPPAGPGDAELYRSLFASLSDAIVVVDSDLRVMTVNPAFAGMFGHHPAESVVGSSAEIFYASSTEFERVSAEIGSRAEDGPITFAAWFQRASGDVFTGELTVCLLRGEDSRVVAIMGIIRDLSAAEAAESARRQAEERTRRLAESAFEAIVITEDGRIVDANDAALHMFGYSPGEAAHLGVADFVPPEYLPMVAGRADMSEAPPMEIEVLRKDGSCLWVEVQGRSWSEGDRALRVTAIRDVSVRRKMAAAQRESDERWRGMLESLQDVYFECTLDDVLTFQSPAADRLYGRDGREMLGRPTRELYVDPARRDALVAILESGHPVQDFEAEFYTATGTVDVSINCKLVLDSKRRPIGTNGTVRDISARKKTERDLRESEQRYRRILETAHEGICLLEPDGTIGFANLSLSEMLGYPAEQLVGRAAESFVAPASADERTRDRDSGWQAGNAERYEAQFVRQDGSFLWAMVSVSPIERPDGPRGALAMLTDITERRRTEQRLELHIRNAPLAVIQWDTDFCVAEWNPAAERIFGWTRDEAHGRHASDLIVIEESREDIDSGWALLLSSSDPVYHVTENVTKDGQRILCEWFNTPLVDDSGVVIGVASLAQDITDTRRITEERDRILDLSIDMMAVIASGGDIRRVNPAWERILGYHDEELVGTNVFHLVHPEDRSSAIREALRTQEGEAVVDLRARMICADGSYRWVSWNVTPVQNGLTYTVARDITAQVEAEQEQSLLMEALEQNAVALAEQAAELDRLRIAAEHLANYDMLTGVRNRRAWFTDAEKSRHAAVALFDIDYFKRINDSHGHPAGDSVLQAVAARLAVEIEPAGLLGRIGGEEFAAVFHVPFHEARAVCERALAAIADHPISLPTGDRLEVTLSAGLAPWRASRGSVREALQATYEEADIALYQAKEAGRRRLVVRGPRAA
jgi:diguanylate cyclase (GGDEF)-like protein/PAS domain S-box-containing protein